MRARDAAVGAGESVSKIERVRLRNAPLLFAAVCFACGVVSSRHWQPASNLILCTGILILLVIAALRSGERASVPAIAAVWLMSGWVCAEMKPLPLVQRAALTYADGLRREVTGTVLRVRELPMIVAQSTGSFDTDEGVLTPWRSTQGGEPRERNFPLRSMDVRMDAIEEVTPDVARMVPIDGGARVTLVMDAGDHVRAIVCGDRVTMQLRMRAPRVYHDPGVWQYPEYLRGEGVGVQGSIKRSLVHLEDGPGTWDCRLEAAQIWASSRLIKFVDSKQNQLLPLAARMTATDAGTLNAMLFGDRSRLDRGLRAQFERTGSFHLFVVAGVHVALVAGALLWLFSWLGVGRAWSTLVTLTGTATFSIFTGFGVPVQRALGMTAIYLLTRLLSRRTSHLNALGAAILAILVVSPRAMFDASFQMTLLAVVAIMGVAVPLGDRSFLPYVRAARRIDLLRLDTQLPPRLTQFRVVLRLVGQHLQPFMGAQIGAWMPAVMVRSVGWAAELVLASVVAEIAMALPMAVYFHRMTPFALPANLICLPLVGLLMGSAVMTFACSLVHPALAMVPAALTSSLLHAIGWVISSMSHVRSGDLRLPAPPAWTIATCIAFWAIAIVMVRRGRLLAWLTVALLPCAMVVVVWPYAPQLHGGMLELTGIDVGQGDSLLTVSPDGKTMLVDGGGPVGSNGITSTTTYDVGEEVVSPYLWSRGLRRLDVVALTHAHSDHMGGLAAVVRNFRPRELWLSTCPHTADFDALLVAAKQAETTVRFFHQGDTMLLGITPVTVLAPARDYIPGAEPGNDDSMVMRLTFGKASVLLEGDAERVTEERMLHDHLLPPTTLLKVGHHGSRTSSSLEFLRVVAARYALISDGRGNTFGHPQPEILERLQNGHTKVYRTDTIGAVTFLLHADGNIEGMIAASH